MYCTDAMGLIQNSITATIVEEKMKPLNAELMTLALVFPPPWHTSNSPYLEYNDDDSLADVWCRRYRLSNSYFGYPCFPLSQVCGLGGAQCAFNLHLGDTALACNHRLRDTRGQILEFLTRRRFSGRFSSPPGSTSHLGVRLVSNSMMEILNKVRSMVWWYSVCIASIIMKIVSLASRCGWRAAVWNNTATVTQTVITGRNFSRNAGSSSLQIQPHDGGRGLVLL